MTKVPIAPAPITAKFLYPDMLSEAVGVVVVKIWDWDPVSYLPPAKASARLTHAFY